uniref:RNase III domain-containing protein n=1 Tax=Tetradesmus obliquus TaxID=3088 RepID=A0A383VZQ5_TETOB
MRSLQRAALLTKTSAADSICYFTRALRQDKPTARTGTSRPSKGTCRVAGLSSNSSSSSYPPSAVSSSAGAPAKRQRLNPAANGLNHSLPSSSGLLQLHGGDSSSLQQLQEFLGFEFRREELLAQACTHSADKQALSYRQLAFVGDAALWMLFAQHAFHTFGQQEDPVSGRWPAQMSGLLSRASCAATARQWGLQAYLQHSSSSSSSRGSGMNNGQWSTDALAEMFEGVMGALLLDSDYSTVQQLLQPWVAESFEAARAASAAKAAAAASTAAAVHDCAVQQQQQQQQQQQGVQGSSWVCAATSSSTCAELEQMVLLLQEQLYQQCGYCFQDMGVLHTCSEHVLQLLSSGSSNPQADKWHFIGFSLLQFAAAQHAYTEQCEPLTSSSMWQQLRWRQQGHGVVAAAAASDSISCNTFSEASSLLSSNSSDFGSFSEDACCNRTSSSSSSNQVHLMSKQMANLTNLRHRAKMWLWLGLDPSPLLPVDSYVLSSKWKLQKAALARCLDLLLAAVYLDGGMQPAMHVLQQLLQQTPPTGLCKAWIPGWAQKSGSSWGGTLYPKAR